MSVGEKTWVGDSLLAFDGEVLEIFGFRGAESIRFHVENLDLDIGEPNRKGKRLVTIKPASRGSGGCAFEVEEDDWQKLEPFLDGVLAAMP